MREIHGTLRSLGLRLLDVHGSMGHLNSWASPDESRRRAGVELVKNRAEFLRFMEGEGHLIMHLPAIYHTDSAEEEELHRRQFAQFEHSMDELLPICEKLDVVLALENMPNDTWELLETAFEHYPANRVGLCYDSGHGNICKDCLPLLERNKSRLRALHLNDNDAVHDAHQPPGMGNVDWETLARILRTSSYRGPLSFEITMRSTPFTHFTAEGIPKAEQSIADQMAFLEDACIRCARISAMVNSLSKTTMTDARPA